MKTIKTGSAGDKNIHLGQHPRWRLKKLWELFKGSGHNTIGSMG